MQALKWHPDRHTVDKEDAQQRFVEVRSSLINYHGAQPHRLPFSDQ